MAPKKLFLLGDRLWKEHQLTGASFDRPFSCMVQGENYPSGAANSGSSATNMGWIHGGFREVFCIESIPQNSLQEMLGWFFFKVPNLRKAGERWSFTQRVWDFLFGGVFVGDVFGGDGGGLSTLL